MSNTLAPSVKLELTDIEIIKTLKARIEEDLAYIHEFPSKYRLRDRADVYPFDVLENRIKRLRESTSLLSLAEFSLGKGVR